MVMGSHPALQIGGGAEAVIEERVEHGTGVRSCKGSVNGSAVLLIGQFDDIGRAVVEVTAVDRQFVFPSPNRVT